MFCFFRCNTHLKPTDMNKRYLKIVSYTQTNSPAGIYVTLIAIEKIYCYQTEHRKNGAVNFDCTRIQYDSGADGDTKLLYIPLPVFEKMLKEPLPDIKFNINTENSMLEYTIEVLPV